MVLELFYGGESLKEFQKFELKPIIEIYSSTIKTADYTLGLLIIGLCYSMLMIYGMSSPFIIEHVFHYSPVVTGYCALLSGVSLMSGGMISKALINKPFLKKITVAISVQLFFVLLMIAVARYSASLYTLMPFVVVIHLVSGFVFNNYFSYCLGRFSKHAGIASGITGGSLYIITSFVSYGIINTIHITNQMLLGVAYLVLSLLLFATFYLFIRAKDTVEQNSVESQVLSLSKG
jgi:DHA1 family bicyclomycin/chloramphenicol resistance-like MFS transporter